MTKAVRTILVPHDGSAISSRSAEMLGPLLSADMRVILLRVDDGETVDEAALAAAERALSANGASVTRRNVKSRDAARAILDVAEELQPNLVAMTTHGRSGRERFTRGSVAERVLRGCPVPLLMTNPYTVAEAPKIESVLVPLDASERSAEVLDSLISIAQAFSARVVLLYVDWTAPTDTPNAAAKRRTMRAADIQEWLANPRERLAAAGLDVSIEIAHGNVAEEVLRRAQPGSHDLLAMTTHGRSGPGRWLLGSTAESVLHDCRLPILLHRVGTTKTE